jgi:superkiller protein 3
MRRANSVVLKLCASWVLLLGTTAAPVVLPAGQEESRHQKAARHAALASAAAQRRDFARAEEEWKKALELEPGSTAALNNLGMVYYLEHKYPDAEAVLGQAVKLDPSLANGRVLLGAALWRQGKLDRAVVELDRALNARLPQAAEKTARTALHGALFAQGKYARALEVLRPMAEKYPQDVDVLYNLGQTHLQIAANSFRRIALSDPESYRVHQILAESLARQGRYRDAILEYKLALERKPDVAGLHYQIGLLYWTNEENPEGESTAIEEFENELKTNPFDAWSEFRLAQIYRKRQETEKATAYLRKAVALDPALVPARIALARDLGFRGSLAEAEMQLHAAIKLEPDNSTAHFRLAQIYKQRGNPAGAAEEMRKFEDIKTQREAARRNLEKALRMVVEPKVDVLDEDQP